ncbi:hypothetical protein [Galbibacter pacificus]|uniref:Uncharacterized protein n=1 Tax=Galbibacter pacificus TaxID=2996052 RepID=A0ABT6FQF3_9FLAO|nr:hypothetical protein [Galbibacter pacificus]MDG3582028.1 hypothetical protein [Galbibacter pacificus]MDG3585498.1 hypothetical protein [Galbibacter pacificus]
MKFLDSLKEKEKLGEVRIERTRYTPEILVTISKNGINKASYVCRIIESQVFSKTNELLYTIESHIGNHSNYSDYIIFDHKLNYHTDA